MLCTTLKWLSCFGLSSVSSTALASAHVLKSSGGGIHFVAMHTPAWDLCCHVFSHAAALHHFLCAISCMANEPDESSLAHCLTACVL